MDAFRPTILVSELVTPRKDCGSVYELRSELKQEVTTQQNAEDEGMFAEFEDDEQDQQQEEYHQRWFTRKTFRQWEGGRGNTK